MANDPKIEGYQRLHPWSGAGEPGLTVRQYFAAIALQGILANPELAKNTISDDVQMAVEYADALIAELNK